LKGGGNHRCGRPMTAERSASMGTRAPGRGDSSRARTGCIRVPKQCGTAHVRGHRVPFEWHHVITLSVVESMALRSAWSQGREIAGCAVLRADADLTYFCGKTSRNRCTANCSCRVAVLRRKKGYG